MDALGTHMLLDLKECDTDLLDDIVRVKQGMFAGFEGTILRRDGEARLLVAVNFMQQGASVVVDDCLLEEL